MDGSAVDVLWADPTSATHALLSATHTDTAASAVSRGSLIYGNSTPAWAELNVGASAGMFLRTDATDAMWSTLILPNAATSTRIVYASAANTYGESANLAFDGSDFTLGSGIRTRMLSQNRFRYLNSMASVRKTADQTALAVNAFTVITFNTETFDTDGLHDNVTNSSRLTFPLAGKWLVISHIYTDVSGTTVPTKLATRILLNGATTIIYAYQDIMLTGGPTDPGLSSSAIISVAANDYVEMGAYVGATSGTWVAQFVAGLTAFEAFYIGE